MHCCVRGVCFSSNGCFFVYKYVSCWQVSVMLFTGTYVNICAIMVLLAGVCDVR